MAVFRRKESEYQSAQERLASNFPHFEPTVANVESATTEHSHGLVRYRGRVFRVPPVPYKQGLWLLALDQELRRLNNMLANEENIRHTVAVIASMLEVFHSLVRPDTLYDRLTWRWRDNPFLHAEINEVNELTRFFCLTRMSLPIEGSVAIRAPQFISWTWPMRRPRLLIGIHAGWHRLETPAVSDTT